MKNFGTTALMLAGLLLSGCRTPTIQSGVETFNMLPVSETPKTIAIMPGIKEDEGSIDFNVYTSKLGERLNQFGFTVVQPNENPKFFAFMWYGVDNGSIITSTYSVPHWGVTGSAGSITNGSISSYGNTAAFHASTTNIPTYGVTGYRTGTTEALIYSRYVSVDIVYVAASAGSVSKQVWRGRLRSKGACGSMAALMPHFIDALFNGFPGPSSRSIDVATPAPEIKNCIH